MVSLTDAALLPAAPTVLTHPVKVLPHAVTVHPNCPLTCICFHITINGTTKNRKISDEEKSKSLTAITESSAANRQAEKEHGKDDRRWPWSCSR
jgi:hypothetical protein